MTRIINKYGMCPVMLFSCVCLISACAASADGAASVQIDGRQGIGSYNNDGLCMTDAMIQEDIKANTASGQANPNLVSLTGRLLLKGSKPNVEAVLETTDGQWRLQGLTKIQMQQLQRKQVWVKGVTVGKEGRGVWRRSIDVERIVRMCVDYVK